MKKIGITGSLASGKSTAGKILSSKNGPLFSADEEVQKLYRKKKFRRLLAKKLNINSHFNIKKKIREIISKNKLSIKKLERIIHPLVRKQMKKFSKANKNKKFTFFEIPLLIESKLMRNFDIIFFIKARKSVRLKRFKAKGGDNKLFNILNEKQLKDKEKIKHCDHVIVNEKNLKILKKNLLDILNSYV